MKEIIFTYILGYFIIILACSIYSLLGFRDLDFFIQVPCSYIIIIFYIVISIYLYLKNRRVEEKLHYKYFFPLISFGISLATMLNMIILKFNTSIGNNSIPMYLLFLSSGVIGPIYEEILFRYIFYNRLKNKYSRNISIFICSIVFGFIHLSPIKIIYAFILGLFLTTIYEKRGNILAPIIVHMSANSIVLLLSEFNIIVLLLSIINFLFSLYLNFKK